MANVTLPIRLLILQNSLMPYRVPLYEALGRQYDLTVCYAQGEALPEALSFEQRHLPSTQWGSMVWQTDLSRLCNQFDVVICMFDLHWLGYLSLAFGKRRYKLIFWGIGVSTENGFDQRHLFDPIRGLLASSADGLLLYSKQAMAQYLNRGISASKIFLAQNTVYTQLPVNYWIQHRNSVRYKLLFVGSMQSRKNIDSLIDSFREIAVEFAHLELHLVGDGPARHDLQTQANRIGLDKSIFFHGEVREDAVLAQHFTSAIACIAPGQAGLSVLKSFSYGVPFITSSSAITGGERFDIVDGANGLLYFDNLTVVLRRLIRNPSQIQRMSEVAFHYYWTQRTLPQMVAGFHQAIHEVLNPTQQ